MVLLFPNKEQYEKFHPAEFPGLQSTYHLWDGYGRKHSKADCRADEITECRNFARIHHCRYF